MVLRLYRRVVVIIIIIIIIILNDGGGGGDGRRRNERVRRRGDKKKNDTENDDQSHAARGREGLKCWCVYGREIISFFSRSALSAGERSKISAYLCTATAPTFPPLYYIICTWTIVASNIVYLPRNAAFCPPQPGVNPGPGPRSHSAGSVSLAAWK